MYMGKIYVVNKRTKPETIRKKYPNAIVLDVTSSSPEAYGACLSPFYPHGNIPIPFSPGHYAESVEGIWQGLKVFESVGIDESSFRNRTGKNIKRTVRKYGKPLGHQKGLNSSDLLDYLSARRLIYLPTYYWMLTNVPMVQKVLERIRERLKDTDFVFLDYDTNLRVEDVSKPLSHAGLIKRFLEGTYPSQVESMPVVALEPISLDQLHLFRGVCEPILAPLVQDVKPIVAQGLLEALGQKLREAREKRHETLDSLSNKIRVAARYVLKAERGESIPSKYLLPIIAGLGMELVESKDYNENLKVGEALS